MRNREVLNCCYNERDNKFYFPNKHQHIIMKISGIEIFAILLLLAIIPTHNQTIAPEACLEFAGGSCTRCSTITHLYDGACYKNILGCIAYSEGIKCKTCQTGNFTLNNGMCNLVAGTNATSDLQKYSGQQQVNPGDQYGQASFIPTSIDTVGSWPSFKAMDDFVRKGEYSYYISRVSKPVYSVHYYQQGQSYSFKVVYYGSGGGLFLCIADVPASFKVDLRSLTPISASSIVYNCYDYDTSGKCLGCRVGHHLQAGTCYPNYGGCLKYFENICLECIDYYLLVENRCVSDCLSLSDAGSILFYGNRTVSTLQIKYTVSISRFYWTQTSQTIASLAQQSNTRNTSNLTKNVISSVVRVQQVNGPATAISNLSSMSMTSFMKPLTLNSTISSTVLSQVSPTPNLNTSIASSSLKISEVLAPDSMMAPFHSSSLVYCANKSNSGGCLKCIQHYFLNQNGECEEVSLLCVSVDQVTGKCTQCFTGYILNLGRCEFKSFH